MSASKDEVYEELLNVEICFHRRYDRTNSPVNVMKRLWVEEIFPIWNPQSKLLRSLRFNTASCTATLGICSTYLCCHLTWDLGSLNYSEKFFDDLVLLLLSALKTWASSFGWFKTQWQGWNWYGSFQASYGVQPSSLLSKSLAMVDSELKE